MIIKKAEFITSAAKPKQYPPAGVPEIAFAGRSNVGKSSLINALLGRKKLVKVSSTPGKTRTINFFNINDEFRIVDLPGYGYARVAKAESDDWGRMMETYLSGREGLLRVIQLVDIRHAPTAQDRQMYDYLRYYGLSGTVAVTKADKLSRNEAAKNLALIRKGLELGPEDTVIPVSSLNGRGIDVLLEEIERLLSGGEND
ncbi:MAG: YihA family ribosome biogenesis GTP-binding protein [Firmicutes bacterium]|nr:YihA family ribosome biogenesis GTP-binding protein [Bacillota bacterium]